MSHTVAGVVLGAGAGTRLRPLTDILPKALCPVDNVPLVDLALDRLRALTDDIAVNVHHRRAQMEAHLAGRGVRVSVEEPEALGTAGALGRLREWIGGRPCAVVNADAWHRFDLSALLDGWDGERVRLLVVHDPDGGDFGPWRYCGAALMPWAEVERLPATPSGLYELSWRQAEAEGRLELVPMAGPYFDCGTPADYLAANLTASGGRSVVGEGATVEGELVRSVVWPGGVVQRGERLVECIRVGATLTVDASRLRIRTFDLADYSAAAGLWESVEGMSAPSLDEVERKLERDPELFLVAEDGGSLVGVVMGSYDGRRGWIFRLAVAPHRRREGIGRALVEELERRYLAMGVRRLRLLTLSDNQVARAFWEHLGYGGFEDVVLFTKDLGDRGAECC